jgi:protein TonB
MLDPRVGDRRLLADLLRATLRSNMLKPYLCLTALALAVATPAFAEKFDPPVPVRTVAPDYPDQMKAKHMKGVVVVKCTIDAQGNVVEPSIEKTSNEGFDQAALDAVKKWKFKPAQRDGNPVEKRVSIPIRFVGEG